MYHTSQVYKELTCSDKGTWETTSAPTKTVNTPVCKSNPCPKMEKENVPSSENIQCEREGKNATVLNGTFLYLSQSTLSILFCLGYFNEEVECTLKSCKAKFSVQQPATTMCQNGLWSSELVCIPTDKTCTEAAIPKVKDGTVDCSGEEKDPVTGDFLGGSLCLVTCNKGYQTTDLVQCRDAGAGAAGMWTQATCGKLSLSKSSF